jgi:hypothetical protein
MATPLVAGIVADAEQGQPTDFGFLNPLLYSLAGSRAYHDILSLRPTDPEVDRAVVSQDWSRSTTSSLAASWLASTTLHGAAVLIR